MIGEVATAKRATSIDCLIEVKARTTIAAANRTATLGCVTEGKTGAAHPACRTSSLGPGSSPLWPGTLVGCRRRKPGRGKASNWRAAKEHHWAVKELWRCQGTTGLQRHHGAAQASLENKNTMELPSTLELSMHYWAAKAL